MRIRLPPSLDREVHGLDKEIERARRLSPEERLRVVAAQCEEALILLRMNEHRETLLRERDPVPDSTRRAYARLRLPR